MAEVPGLLRSSGAFAADRALNGTHKYLNNRWYASFAASVDQEQIAGFVLSRTCLKVDPQGKREHPTLHPKLTTELDAYQSSSLVRLT